MGFVELSWLFLDTPNNIFTKFYLKYIYIYIYLLTKEKCYIKDRNQGIQHVSLDLYKIIMEESQK
jgi:hypothetical protein